MATVTKLAGNGSYSIEELRKHLINGSDGELVCDEWKGFDGGGVLLLCFEKFFFRTSSYASLTVLLTEVNGAQTADIIGSGGGTGLLNIGWGANASFADSTEMLLRRYGFSPAE